MTAPGCGSCGSTTRTTRRPRSPSPTTSSPGSLPGPDDPDRQRAEFQSSFHWHLLDKGIRHRYIKPATPRLNGKVERSHRIDAEEFYRLLDGVVIDDTKLFNDKLAEWENFYNYHPPTAASAGRPPTNGYGRRRRPRFNDLCQLHSAIGSSLIEVSRL
jgi:transposase InsO family protein